MTTVPTPKPVVLLGLIALCASILSCGQDQPTAPNDPRVSTSKTTAAGKIEGRTKLLEPELLYGHDTAMVAMMIERERRKKESPDQFWIYPNFAPAYTSERVTADEATLTHTSWATQTTLWHNVLFRDVTSDESWMLLNTRGVVNSFSKAMPVGTDPQTRQIVRTGPLKLLAFLVTTDDTDGDGVLTSLDARVCIITDGDGRNPRTITPKDSHVLSTQYDRDRDLLWIQTAIDSNGDGQYTGEDDQIPLFFNPQADTTAQPVVDDKLVKEAAALLKGD